MKFGKLRTRAAGRHCGRNLQGGANDSQKVRGTLCWLQHPLLLAGGGDWQGVYALYRESVGGL